MGFMKRSSWSINDFPPDDYDPPEVEHVAMPERKLTRAERRAIDFERIRHRKGRKGKGSIARRQKLRRKSK